jgi:EmrB/QacA subfamily drug resistance transporter
MTPNPGISSDGESLTRTQKTFTMVGALLGLLLAALDQTIVATAGPDIQRDLRIEPSLYVWITTAYLVASTVLVPIYGKLSDLYGRKRILLIAIGIFLLGSLLCGISQSPAQLIAFRAVQGIGSAGLFTSAFAVVADLFPPAERGKYQGLFGAAFGVSSVIGPLLGGFITDHFGWHWVFFVNLPIGAIAIGFIASRMPPLRSVQERRPRLDIAGAVALTVATLPLLLALSLGRSEGGPPGGWPWSSWQILVMFALAATGVLAFIAIERRAANPLLDLTLFRNRTFSIGSLAAFVVGAAFLGAIVFLPLFMVNVVGLSATSSGLTTTPLTFGIVAANIATGHLVSRLGKYKALLLGSLVVLVAGFVIFALTLEPDATQLGVSAKMVILGIGLGPAIPLFTLAIQSAVKPAQIGVATSSATFARQMGATIGLAIVGTVFATSFSARLHEDMPVALRDAPPVLTEVMARQRADHSGEGNAQVAFDAPKVKQAITASIAHLPIAPEQRAAVQAQADASVDRVAATFKQAFTGAIVRVFWVSLGIALLGLLITLVLPVVPLRKAAGPPPPVE